jgi:DNA-binding transcriptional MerR regulator
MADNTSRKLSIAFRVRSLPSEEPILPSFALSKRLVLDQGFNIGNFSLDSVDDYRVYVGRMDGLTRSQLAQRAQINLETVRFYEKEGLLPPAPRTASGYRKFSENMIEILAFVKRAKALGFSLEETRELLNLQHEHADACAEVRDLLRDKLSVVHEKKAELEKLEAHLSAALRKCNQALRQQSKACPTLRQMADSRSRKNTGGSHV